MRRRLAGDAVVALGCLAMGLLTFSLNLTLDGCVDHQEGIGDEETHAFFTRLLDERGAILWGRVTYEIMNRPGFASGYDGWEPALGGRVWLGS